MIATLYINDDAIGEADFQIIDESMGAIGGQLTAFPNYEKYRSQIQKLEIANIQNFPFKLVLSNGIMLEPEGGISITDLKEFDEIDIDAAGLHFEILQLYFQTNR